MTTSPSIQQQKQFYNDRWQDFEFANRLKLARCTAILQCLFLTGKKHPRIIDLGCGAGWLASILGHFGPTVGVELSSAAVEEASRKYPHVNFLQADVFSWAYPKGQFDVVVSQEVVEHVEDQESYLAIAADLLVPDGHLILTTPNPRTFNAMSTAQRDSWSDQPLENWITIRELRNQLAQRFHLEKVTTIIPGYGRKGIYRVLNSTRFNRLSRRLRVDDVYKAVILKLGFGLHTLAVGRRLPD